ncbi:MAG: thioesterase domain-containing protein [Lyngbya sp.]|nr:thioesterase domain-containing protein [Lyngbya sp.]
MTFIPSKRELSSLEQKIAAIWSQCLGISEIEPDADFFEIGGDSLLATQLVTGLRTQLQVDLETHSLLQAPTIAQLATLISGEITPSETRQKLPHLVVEIQPGNPTHHPLVLMHPVGGHVYFYRELARHLDSQFPVYGIRAQGVEGEAEPLTNMTDMVQVYTAALQTFQPHGPYYLGGASFGGTLEQLEIASEIGTLKMRWSDFHRYKVGKDLVLLYSAPGRFHVFHRRFFDSDEDFQTFVAYLEAHL